MTAPADMACRVLVRLQSGLPVDPTAILARCPGVLLRPYRAAGELLPPKERMAEACTVRDGERCYVLYNDRVNAFRLRFSLAHELGHILLHHTGGRTDEQEADVFASQLLVPRAALRLWAAGTDALCAEQVAAACRVTVPCASMALRDHTLPRTELLRETEALLAPSLPPLRAVRPDQAHQRHWLGERELSFWQEDQI